MRTASSISIRALTKADLPQIVTVHRAAFHSSAITRAGAEAVRRYYAWLFDGPHDGYAIGAFQGEELMGFCFGGRYRGALSGYLRKHRVFLISRILMRPWLLADSFFVSRMFAAGNALRRFGWSRPKADTQMQQQQPSFAILSIATHPQAQRTGIGRALLEEAKQEAQSRGFARMHLSVSPENGKAIRFYEREGWQKVDEEGTWKGQMQKRCSE